MGWVGLSQHAVEIGNHLLRQLIHGLDRKLLVRVGNAEGWAKAEHCPSVLVAEARDEGLAAGNAAPECTRLKTVGSNPDLARETWSGR